MALKDAIRVAERTTTSGTGALTLAGALPQYQPVAAKFVSGDQAIFTVLDSNGTDWETFLGTVTVSAGTTTVSRDQVIDSSNAGNLVSLSTPAAGSSHTVFLGPVAGLATGDIDHGYNAVIKPDMRAYTETVASPAVSAGALTLDMATANVFDVTLTANVTTLTIVNVPAGAAQSTLILRQDATGGRSVTWPASFRWLGGAAPTLQTGANGVDVVTLFSTDGGTEWIATHAGGAV